MTSEESSEKVLKALNWQPPKKITQESFDEAVRDNIDALDMTPEEAVQSAIEEFHIQGVDMSDIIQTADGGDISRHPVMLALAALQGATTSADECETAVAAVLAHLRADDAGALQQALAVAHRAHALRDVLLLANAEAAELGVVLPLLSVARALLQTSAIRDSFAEQSTLQGQTFFGPSVASDILNRHRSSGAVAAAIGRVCAAAATECEESKCKLMESDFPATALAIVAADGASLDATQELCSALKMLMTHDDLRPPASKAFMHSRILAIDHGAVPVFLTALQRAGEHADVLNALVPAVQQLCANDEICKRVCDAQGVQMVMRLMDTHFAHSGVVASTCGLLRQLAKSDDVKVLFVEISGLPMMVKVLDAHKRSAKVCTQAFGLIATVLLRQPDHCDAAFHEPGLMDHVLDGMRAHSTNASVARQACQLLRNLVVRNTQLRAPLLDLGVEPLLRAAKKLQDCDDVAAAGLRDLGFDNYNT